jgi:hypothetical protein
MKQSHELLPDSENVRTIDRANSNVVNYRPYKDDSDDAMPLPSIGEQSGASSIKQPKLVKNVTH